MIVFLVMYCQNEDRLRMVSLLFIMLMISVFIIVFQIVFMLFMRLVLFSIMVVIVFSLQLLFQLLLVLYRWLVDMVLVRLVNRLLIEYMNSSISFMWMLVRCVVCRLLLMVQMCMFSIVLCRIIQDSSIIVIVIQISQGMCRKLLLFIYLKLGMLLFSIVVLLVSRQVVLWKVVIVFSVIMKVLMLRKVIMVLLIMFINSFDMMNMGIDQFGVVLSDICMFSMVEIVSIELIDKLMLVVRMMKVMLVVSIRLMVIWCRMFMVFLVVVKLELLLLLR